jgi:hypothetical protein
VQSPKHFLAISRIPSWPVAYISTSKSAIDRCKYPAYTQDKRPVQIEFSWRETHPIPNYHPHELISFGSRRTCAAQESLSPVQAEEAARRTPESFLHTILQYSNKRTNSNNEDANSKEGMICAKIPDLENDILECPYRGLGGQLGWRVDDLW